MLQAVYRLRASGGKVQSFCSDPVKAPDLQDPGAPLTVLSTLTNDSRPSREVGPPTPENSISQKPPFPFPPSACAPRTTFPKRHGARRSEMAAAPVDTRGGRSAADAARRGGGDGPRCGTPFPGGPTSAAPALCHGGRRKMAAAASMERRC